MAPIQSSSSPNLKKHQISEECKQLCLTLPKEEGWAWTRIYRYQGFWLNSYFLQGVVNAQTHFRALPSDIILATLPKSGTTWLKAILFSLLNRRTHPVDTLDHPLTTHNPHELVPYLDFDLYVDGKFPDLSHFSSPRILAAHIPFLSLPNSILESRCKIVYLCRDPKDTFVSMWHFMNKARPSERGVLPLDEAFEKFCRGVSLYGPFWDHVLGYWNASLQRPTEVLFLKYEEFKRDPASHARRLAEFLGCGFSSIEEESGVVEKVLGLCSFDHLSNLEVNKEGSHTSGMKNASFFRRGEVGDWANYLTPEMVQKLERINKEKLHGLGLMF